MDREAILVVDDEPGILGLVRAILESSGFSVLAARTGQEALNLLASNRIDALLTDIVMPGMDGFQLIEEATNRCPELAVCVMTGYSAKHQERLKEVPFLPKPFPVNQLIETVQQAVAKRKSVADPNKPVRPPQRAESASSSAPGRARRSGPRRTA